MQAKLIVLLSLWLCPSGAYAAPTPTPTPTFTTTSTQTLMPTSTPRLSNTPSPTLTWTPSPPLSPTVTPSGTRMPSPDYNLTDIAATLTAQAAQSPTTTPTAAPTLPLSPTVTPRSPLTPALTGTTIASFEGGDPVTPVAVSAQGGTIVLTVVPGCPYGSSGSACNASGACSGAPGSVSQLFLSATAGVVDASAAESAVRRLTFHVLAGTLPGQQLKVTVNTAYGDFSAVVTVPATGVWTDVTVSLPDDQAPGALPQLQPDALDPPTQPWAVAIQSCTGISIQPAAAGAFNFTVDDVQWGVAVTGASPSQVAAALGVSLADVEEAYSYGLGDQGTWILLILSKHCGCHPHSVIALRSTLSWGQIAVQEGSTWTAILAEVNADMLAAGLVPQPPTLDQMLRTETNGPPSTTPLPSPTPYVPSGPVVMPAPGGC